MIAARPQVVITGAGASCAIGTGCEALWEALSTGRDGLRPITRFSIAEFPPHFAGLWPGWDQTAPAAIRALELATLTAREAWAQARLDEASVAPARIGLILGTCFGEELREFSELTQRTAQALGIEGPCLTVSTACSSSTTAIGLARDLIDEGAADVVIAGGVDFLTRGVFAGFHAVGALSADKCAPFGQPVGMSLGEGSGFVVCETAERAQARKAAPLAFVLGYGLSADAHHETSPDPSGSGVGRAIHAALADAGMLPEEIDFVSAHGTGTDSNDAAEWLAIRTALGPTSERVPVSSIKSFFGHAQGAAGVLELVGAITCLKRGLIPPTLRAHPPRPGAPLDPVAGNRPRAHPVRHTLKLSAAFGGANAALVIGQTARERAQPPARRAVQVAGLAAIGPHGIDVAQLEAAFGGGHRLTGPVPAFVLEDLVRSAPDRDVDPSGKYATAAASLALADARLVVKGAARARSGIFTGNTRMPAKSVHDCQTSIERRGINAVAAGPFTRMVLNAPAGTCAKLLSLKGPLLVLSAGASSGLLAIIRAAQHLATRGCADLLVAGGLDELPIKDAEGLAEGAAFVALRAGAEVTPASVTVASWALAGPNRAAQAVTRALEGQGPVDGVFAAMPNPLEALGGAVDPARLPLGVVDVEAFAGGAEAAVSAYAFVLAVARLRRGGARRLLVVSTSASISCAAVVAGGPDGQ